MNVVPPPDNPSAWLARARSDLNLARAALTTVGVLREDACFHAQQAAEKALKALLIHQGVAFPRTHVIEHLLDLLQAASIPLPSTVDEAVTRTQYAVQTRYPGIWEPVTKAEAEEALQIAQAVLTWVEQQLGPVS